MKEFISFHDGGKLVLRIKTDGNIELGDGIKLDQVSDLFYRSVCSIMMENLPDLIKEVNSKDIVKILILAGDRMASRIELLEHHKLADEHDIVARNMWIKTKDAVS